MAQKVGVPDYAMQPAKAVRTVEAKARYEKTEFVSMGKQQQVSFRVEEDILVPDIKPDMEDILSIKADCDVNPRERSLICGEDLVNWTGNIHLQVVYRGISDEIIPLTSQIPYKHQWKTVQESESEAVFSVSVGNIESTIVNERKLRLSITLDMRITCCRRLTVSVLSSLEDDNCGSLQVRKQPVAVNSLSTVCKDEMEIVESFPRREGIVPREILRQDYSVSENYKQITGDKIVLNGFIHVLILYSGHDQQSTDNQDVICQQYERIEFTQFVPIPKNARGKECSFSHVVLSGRDFHTEIVSPLRGEQGENLSSQKEFQCSGVIETKVVLFEKIQTQIAVDAYHTVKELEYVSQPKAFQTMCLSQTMEINTRDFVLPVQPPASNRSHEAGLFAYCTFHDVNTHMDTGKLAIEGTLLWSVCYLDRDSSVVNMKERIPFQATFEPEVEISSPCQDCTVSLARCGADFTGDGRIELHSQLTVHFSAYGDFHLVELAEPVFLEGFQRKTYPLIIAKLSPGETLWDVAKRHHITEESIRQTTDGRLLIMK